MFATLKKQEANIAIAVGNLNTNAIKKLEGDNMSSKKYGNKSKGQQKEFKSMHSPIKVWAVRIVVVLLCIAVAITLIPSVFF